MSHDSKVTTWSNVGTTLGAVGLIALIAQGSDAATTITIRDGTAIKYAPVIATTQGPIGFIFPHKPVAFANLNTIITGTCSYSITFYPRP